MPKSRGRKNRRKTQRVTKRMIDARTRQILEGQRQRFREKFGRDWQEMTPCSSIPTPQSQGQCRRSRWRPMYSRPCAGPAHHLRSSYAYRKTGLILTEDMRSNWPADRLREWDDAIDEYFAIEDAQRRPRDRPGAVVNGDTGDCLLPVRSRRLNKVREILER